MVKSKPKPSPFVLYVEGGGDRNPSLAAECRRAFQSLFERAGVSRKPRVVACGGRRHAYEQFCHGLNQGQEALLLVDAEALLDPTHANDYWGHLKAREGDGWERPSQATQNHVHLMVVCMETWLLSDQDALSSFFGQDFKPAALFAPDATLEQRDKQSVYRALADATRACRVRGAYGKGAHSFKLLATLDPQKLRVLPCARRFLDALL